MVGKRVLLVEPHAIGAVQSSACGTLLAVLEATGTLGSLLQAQQQFVLHLQRHTLEDPIPYPFCTFDNRVFCSRLLAQGDAELLQASVLGHRGHKVFTTRGPFDAQILIDTTGWRAALATNSRRQAERHSGKSFGLETNIPESDKNLHFYYEPRRLRPHSVAWLFPAGAQSRLGHTRLNETLAEFSRRGFGCTPDGRHGGYFPYRRRPATTGPVFRAGDAAGQCIPLTGEGIRPALYFGAAAGRLARRVLDGELRESDALREYGAFVEQRAAIYRYFLVVQKILPGLPMAWIEFIAGRVQQPEWLNPLLRGYWNAFNPDSLALGWRGDTPSKALPRSQPVSAMASIVGIGVKAKSSVPGVKHAQVKTVVGRATLELDPSRSADDLGQGRADPSAGQRAKPVRSLP